MAAAAAAAVRTPTALKRWSYVDRALPKPADVRLIAVFDFDNTLFRSPVPNPNIWSPTAVNKLSAMEPWVNNGWWHERAFLESTGRGIDIEQPRAWEGYWDERVVHEARICFEMPDKVLTVLLTGRNQTTFGDLVSSMVSAKQLPFHMVCLKPAVGPSGQAISSTMKFKQQLFRDLLTTYSDTPHIIVLEDRPQHTKAFRTYFEQLNAEFRRNTSQTARQPIDAHIVQVNSQPAYLDPAREVELVRQLLSDNDAALAAGKAHPNIRPLTINVTPIDTVYSITDKLHETQLIDLIRNDIPKPVIKADVHNAQTILNMTPGKVASDETTFPREVKTCASAILISSRPATPHVHEKAGREGDRLRLRVIATASFENKLWAARVEPVDPKAKYFTEKNTLCVLIAKKDWARESDIQRISTWRPLASHQVFEFDTVVTTRGQMSIDRPLSNGPVIAQDSDIALGNENEFPALGADRPAQRSHRGGPSRNAVPRGVPRDRVGQGRGGRLNRGGFHNTRGGRIDTNHRRGGGPQRGRGRGGGSYKSLDDTRGQTFEVGNQY